MDVFEGVAVAVVVVVVALVVAARGVAMLWPFQNLWSGLYCLYPA